MSKKRPDGPRRRLAVVRKAVKIIVYLDKSGDYRWKSEAENDEIIAESAEGYRREGYATRMARKVAPAELVIED